MRNTKGTEDLKVESQEGHLTHPAEVGATQLPQKKKRFFLALLMEML